MPRGAPKHRAMKKDQPGWLEFTTQRGSAKQRGIDFLFTFEDWWAWWQVDGRWARRGRCAGNLVMARKGDAGPYRSDNVYCITKRANTAEAFALGTIRVGLAKAMAEGRMRCPHLCVRGEAHPKARPVITPYGRYGSAALAAEAFGIGRQEAARKARLGLPGWRYEAPE